jgi:hypothetical protein
MNKKEIIASNFKLLIIALITAVSVFMIASFLLSCSKDNETNPAPTITSFSPSSGLVGATVVITGINFSSTAANNTVKVTNASATVTAATSTQLTITVPPNATTGKISVTVNGQIATSAIDFTISLPVPTITNFAPLGAVPGSSLVITGTNFRTILNENTVKVNGVLAIVTAATSTQLTVTIPAGATTGKVAVEINGVTATSVTDFEALKDIPRNGLVAIYPFTGNGNCTNNSLLNFNFSLADAPTLVSDRHNRPSQAISFNGTSQYSEIFNEVIPGQPWTVSFWMDPGNLTLHDHEIMTGYLNNRGYDITLRVNNNDPSKYYVYTSHVGAAGLTYLSPTNSYLPAADAGNIWINIILTFDGSTFKVYKDGVEIISNPVTPAIPLTAGLRFKIGGDAGKSFIGKLDDIVIYNRVLSTAERTQLFQQTVSKY